jgi:hypothetical protein
VVAQTAAAAAAAARSVVDAVPTVAVLSSNATVLHHVDVVVVHLPLVVR